MNATEDLGWLDSPSSLNASVERLKAVKAVGLDAGLDFHGRVHKPMAKQLAKLLEPHQPLFIEEPLLSEHPEAIKHFSQQTTIPIALGERLYSRWDIKPFLEASSVDVLQPDVSHCGGISEIRRIAAMCEAYDVGLGKLQRPNLTSLVVLMHARFPQHPIVPSVLSPLRHLSKLLLLRQTSLSRRCRSASTITR